MITILKLMLTACIAVAASLTAQAGEVTFTAGTDKGETTVTKDGVKYKAGGTLDFKETFDNVTVINTSTIKNSDVSGWSVSGSVNQAINGNGHNGTNGIYLASGDKNGKLFQMRLFSVFSQNATILVLYSPYLVLTAVYPKHPSQPQITMRSIQ